MPDSQPQGEREIPIAQGEIEATNASPLPIPQVTVAKRDLKYQQAARLYIHHGHTNISELARKLDLDRPHLSRIASEDGWNEYAARYHAITHSGNQAWSLLGRRSGEELASIASERSQRQAQLSRVERQRDGVLARLDAGEGTQGLPACPDPTTPEHARLVATLARLNQILAELSGLADLMREEGEKRRAAIGIEAQVLKMQAQAPKTPDPSDSARPAAGTVIDFGA